jgi:hypothetical protein
MSSINWDRELAKLEREFDGLPPEPSPVDVRERRVVGPGVSGRASTLGVWARLALVATLAGALAFWPYARGCGPGLFAFLGAGAMIVFGGIWVSACTWRSRMGFAHTLAFGLVLAGLAVVGYQVLPRIGYAKVDPANPPHWQCVSPPSLRAGR